MSAPESYIDRCVAAVETIDRDALSQLEQGPAIGLGSQFMVCELGKVGLLGSDWYACAKLDKKNRDLQAELRLEADVEFIELLLTHMPELQPRVPQFMALLAVEGSSPAAILTEDVSQGQTLPMSPVSFLDDEPYTELCKSIAAAFKDVEDIKVHPAAINYALEFMVGGQSRLLDFTPPPLEFTGSNNVIAERIIDLELDGKLTVTIPADSPLGLSLPRPSEK